MNIPLACTYHDTVKYKKRSVKILNGSITRSAKSVIYTYTNWKLYSRKYFIWSTFHTNSYCLQRTVTRLCNNIIGFLPNNDVAAYFITTCVKIRIINNIKTLLFHPSYYTHILTKYAKQTAIEQWVSSNCPNFQLLLIPFNNVIKQTIWKTSMVSTTLTI